MGRLGCILAAEMGFSLRRRAHFYEDYLSSLSCAFSKHARASAAGGLFWVAWAVSLKSPAPLGRPGPDPCSPKWLPQAPSKATTENSVYHRDWRSPGAPITSKKASGLDGVHISTKANVHHVWAFSKNLRTSAAGGPFWVAWVVCWRLPAPLGRPGPQKHPKGTPRTRFGSSGVVSWKPPGPLWEASRPPKAFQG